MKILVITPYIPMPDRGSGELRLFSLLKILTESHHVTLYTWSWGQEVSDAAKRLYRENVIKQGVTHRSDGLRALLRRECYDAIIFEWYYWVDWYLDDVKTWQLDAKIIIDTVDIEFRRLGLQAETTGDFGREQLRERKGRELSAYKQADMLIAVSAEEKAILAAELPGKEIGIIPNIHSFPESLPPLSADPNVIFIGNFRFDPNLDAVQYFCSEVWPAVCAKIPQAKLTIVGNALPADLALFQARGIEAIGYVPDTAPYLARSRVSVAPLRFGAGVKGKVGEAIAAGIPVITTSIGVQGLPLVSGRDVRVADAPNEFAASVVQLLTDPEACERQRQAAWSRLKVEFGVDAVRVRVAEVLARVRKLKSKPLPMARRWARRMQYLFDQHLLWRLPTHSKPESRAAPDPRLSSIMAKKDISR